MKRPTFLLALCALVLAGCGTTRNALEKLTDLIPARATHSRKIVLSAYVCRPSEPVRDTNGIDLGLYFLVAPVGQACDLGARQVYVAAVLSAEIEKTRRLEVGQSVTIRGELALRALTLKRLAATSEGDGQPLNEAIVAESIHPQR